MRRREFLQVAASSLACAQAPAIAARTNAVPPRASRGQWAAYVKLARPTGWTYISGSGPTPTIEELSKALGPVYGMRASAA